MTIQELIDKLSQYPTNLAVVLVDIDGDNAKRPDIQLNVVRRVKSKPEEILMISGTGEE